MNDELPKSWRTAPLDSLCQKFRGVSYGRDEASSVPKKGCIPILRANNLQNDRLVFDELVWVSSDCVNSQQKLRTGDIVIAMSSGSKSVVGKTAQVLEDWQGSFGAFCGVLRPWPELNSRYVGLFLRTREYRSTISELAAGSNINNLKNEHLAAIEVPVAPLPEQRRIVAKVETLLDKVDASQQRLTKIPVLLKRFRQSVLAAACSGRLTADWREQRPTEDAEDTDGDTELPRSWKSVEFGELVGDGPQNGLYKPASFYGDGALIVRIDAFYDGTIAAWDELKRVRLTEKERIQFALRNDDILVNRVNSPKFLGKCALVRNLKEPCVYESNMMRLRLDTSRALPDYAILYLQSLPGLVELRKNAKHAVNQSSINQEDVKAAMFNLPPLPEQQEIVRRVEGLFALADQLELRLARARGQVDKLTPSLLVRAFAGKLVPQDPNDEPASVLLERIRQRRNGTEHNSDAKAKTKTNSSRNRRSNRN